MILSKEDHSLKMSLLAIVLTAALAVATPEYARAQDSNFKGFYFKAEGRGNIAAGDEAPYAGDTRGPEIYDIGLDATGSFRVGAGIRFGSSWDIGLLYSGLKTTGKDPRIDAYPFRNLYAINTIGTFAGPLTADFAQARSEFTYNVVDFEAGYTLNLGRADIRLFAGVRYADTLHNVNARIYTLAGQHNFDRDVDQWGIGPRLGFEAAVPVGSGGLHLTIGGSASALFGDRERTDTVFSTNIPGGGFLTRTSEDSNTLYNADAEVGIGYGVELGNARSILITLGYRGEGWWDVTDTSTGGIAIPSGGSSTFGDQEEDMFFHGPFLRGMLNF